MHKKCAQKYSLCTKKVHHNSSGRRFGDWVVVTVERSIFKLIVTL